MPIAEDVSQKQANQIVAILNTHGIPAEASRMSGGRGKFSVRVKQGYYSTAVTLLDRNNLPGEPEASFNELIAKRGIIPDSREVEALRIDHAMAVQLQEVLESHPQIVDAKAVVRLNYNREDAEPAVSVMVQKKPQANLDLDELKALVSQAVPGVNSENVKIALSEASPKNIAMEEEGVFLDGDKVLRMPLVPFLFGWKVPSDDYDGIAVTLLIMIIFVGFIGGIVGYWYSYIQHSRRDYVTDLPQLASGSLKLEDTQSDCRRFLSGYENVSSSYR